MCPTELQSKILLFNNFMQPLRLLIKFYKHNLFVFSVNFKVANMSKWNLSKYLEFRAKVR